MRDFNKDLQHVRKFCVEHRIGFGGDDKEDDDTSVYAIAYEVDNSTLFLYLVEDETETTDQNILDTVIIKIYQEVDLIAVIKDKCIAHKMISE